MIPPHPTRGSHTFPTAQPAPPAPPRWLAGARGQRAVFRRLVVVGCGLIGGSIAASARLRWPGLQLIGVDEPSVLEAALARGVITEAAPVGGWLKAITLRPDDLVVLALPLQRLEQTVTEVAARYRTRADGPLWMDVASVKAPIVTLADAVGMPRFIGGHPMAGSATHGLAAHSPTLFHRRPFVLCPAQRTTRADVERVMHFVVGLGAHPVEHSPDRHDQLIAITSHLPHLVAQALMSVANATECPGELWKLAAGSWRDATRVAKSDPAMWASIFRYNRIQLADAAARLVELLQAAIERLGAPDGADEPIGAAVELAALRHKLDGTLPPIG